MQIYTFFHYLQVTKIIRNSICCQGAEKTDGLQAIISFFVFTLDNIPLLHFRVTNREMKIFPRAKGS